METQIAIRGNVAQPGSTQINNVQLNTGRTVDEINRACLHALRNHDPFEVKIRLKENKDKLIHQCFDWILHTSEYIRWQDGDEIDLLWIKGGAGKGKTMISIGLVEKLSQNFRGTGLVTYFFCQNADSNLNSVESILKGLILQLVKQEESLKSILRDRWNTAKEAFDDDMKDWRVLWTTFTEMLSRRICPKLFVVVDALDECRDENLASLLRLIIRTGLSNSSEVKWLLTSRALDTAGNELLTASDQELVSLDLNDEHISRGVAVYISHKVTELNRHWGPGLTNTQELVTKLTEKAEGTMLWVSLVCKRLEHVPRANALTVIDDLPPDLSSFYDRAYRDLCSSRSPLGEGCARLLQAMMLAFRPLRMGELYSVAHLPKDRIEIEELVERSSSFVKKRDDIVEFIHQSARDYLASIGEQVSSTSKNSLNHLQMASNCLSYLALHLKTNLLQLPIFEKDSNLPAGSCTEPLASLEYPATFWSQHLHTARENAKLGELFSHLGLVHNFIDDRFLNWLECLSLLDQLYTSLETLHTLTSIMVDSLQASHLPHYHTRSP